MARNLLEQPVGRNLLDESKGRNLLAPIAPTPPIQPPQVPAQPVAPPVQPAQPPAPQQPQVQPDNPFISPELQAQFDAAPKPRFELADPSLPVKTDHPGLVKAVQHESELNQLREQIKRAKGTDAASIEAAKVAEAEAEARSDSRELTTDRLRRDFEAGGTRTAGEVTDSTSFVGDMGSEIAEYPKGIARGALKGSQAILQGAKSLRDVGDSFTGGGEEALLRQQLARAKEANLTDRLIDEAITPPEGLTGQLAEGLTGEVIKSVPAMTVLGPAQLPGKAAKAILTAKVAKKFPTTSAILAGATATGVGVAQLGAAAGAVDAAKDLSIDPIIEGAVHPFVALADMATGDFSVENMVNAAFFVIGGVSGFRGFKKASRANTDAVAQELTAGMTPRQMAQVHAKMKDVAKTKQQHDAVKAVERAMEAAKPKTVKAKVTEPRQKVPPKTEPVAPEPQSVVPVKPKGRPKVDPVDPVNPQPVVPAAPVAPTTPVPPKVEPVTPAAPVEPPKPQGTTNAEPPDGPTITRGKDEVSPEGTFSNRKVDLNRDRAKFNRSELDSPSRRKHEELRERALMKTADESDAMLQDVADKGRQMTDVEIAEADVRLVELSNEYDELLKRVSKTTDKATLDDLNTQIERLEAKHDFTTTTSAMAGRETGRALAARKLTLNDQMDLVNVINRAKINKNKGKKGEAENLTAVERKKFEDQVGKLEKMNKDIKAEFDTFKADQANAAIKSTPRTPRGGRRSRGMAKGEPKTIQQLFAKADELLKAGCR